MNTSIKQSDRYIIGLIKKVVKSNEGITKEIQKMPTRKQLTAFTKLLGKKLKLPSADVKELIDALNK